MTFLRTVLVLSIVYLVYVGAQEAAFSFSYPEPVTVNPSSVDTEAQWLSDDLIWSRLDGVVTSAAPLLIASDTGNARGGCVALVSPDEPKVVLAVVPFGTYGEAKRFCRRGGTVDVEGLSSVPTARMAELMENYAARDRLYLSPSWRVIEPDSGPVSAAGWMGFVLAGLLLGGLLYASYRAEISTLPFERVQAAVRDRFTSLAGVPTIADEPLSPEFKVQVRHAMSEVWEEATAEVKEKTQV